MPYVFIPNGSDVCQAPELEQVGAAPELDPEDPELLELPELEPEAELPEPELEPELDVEPLELEPEPEVEPLELEPEPEVEPLELEPDPEPEPELPELDPELPPEPEAEPELPELDADPVPPSPLLGESGPWDPHPIRTAATPRQTRDPFGIGDTLPFAPVHDAALARSSCVATVHPRGPRHARGS
jgi:hypothetical protein